MELLQLALAFGKCSVVVKTVNDLIKMQLKYYLASRWSLERRRLMAEEKKGAGCYISIHSDIVHSVRRHSMKKLDLV